MVRLPVLLVWHMSTNGYTKREKQLARMFPVAVVLLCWRVCESETTGGSLRVYTCNRSSTLCTSRECPLSGYQIVVLCSIEYAASYALVSFCLHTLVQAYSWRAPPILTLPLFSTTGTMLCRRLHALQ